MTEGTAGPGNRARTTHAAGPILTGGVVAWPVCTSTRGPLPIRSPRFAETETVTCLRCLDILTRPEVTS